MKVHKSLYVLDFLYRVGVFYSRCCRFNEGAQGQIFTEQYTLSRLQNLNSKYYTLMLCDGKLGAEKATFDATLSVLFNEYFSQ